MSLTSIIISMFGLMFLILNAVVPKQSAKMLLIVYPSVILSRLLLRWFGIDQVGYERIIRFSLYALNMSKRLVVRTCKHISFSSVLGSLATVGALAVATLSPIMRQKGYTWTSLNSWSRAIYLSVIPLCAALYLKYAEKFHTMLKRRKKYSSRKWLIRKMTCANAIIEIDSNRKGDLFRGRRLVLESAAYSIAELLMCEYEEICVNLLVS